MGYTYVTKGEPTSPPLVWKIARNWMIVLDEHLERDGCVPPTRKGRGEHDSWRVSLIFFPPSFLSLFIQFSSPHPFLHAICFHLFNLLSCFLSKINRVWLVLLQDISSKSVPNILYFSLKLPIKSLLLCLLDVVLFVYGTWTKQTWIGINFLVPPCLFYEKTCHFGRLAYIYSYIYLFYDTCIYFHVCVWNMVIEDQWFSDPVW